jgi:hypothetical protein
VADTLLSRERKRVDVLELFQSVRLLRPMEPVLYACWAGALTLLCACWFYSSLRLQTTFADIYRDPAALEAAVQGGLGPWSAPLDDVFIHFDFARQAARGHPFEWSPGNGYSSGGTSLLYPLLLAPGIWLGFTGLGLMRWAAIVACVCVFGALLAQRRLFRSLPAATSYLLPPMLLAVGALNWSLWSGMEVALLLGLWSLALVAWDDLDQAVHLSDTQRYAGAAVLGGSGLLICATRPEGIVLLAAFAGCTLLRFRSLAPLKLLILMGLVLGPAFFFSFLQALVNRLLTGDATAAGALVKLELHHPYLSMSEILSAWWFHTHYQVLRVTHYHFSDVPPLGWIPWLLAAYALFDARTRGRALLLWLSIAGWIVLVALNGQVRWQNERYTMPAVALLLAGAALGLAAALAPERRRSATAALVPALIGASLVALFAWRQTPRFREQVWFFGRASRNIYDQHVQAGRLLRDALHPRPSRVLVGDAGAIPYIADIPAIDMIGLGGYRGLPFARATRQSSAAGLELIERLEPAERPDVLAIYPNWWGDLPLWFGRRVAEVPVRGNVICGGRSKVIYRARWDALDASSHPFSLRPGEAVVDELDFADLLSEAQHGYRAPGGKLPRVTMRLLPNPLAWRRDLWDAARLAPAGRVETFTLSELDPSRDVTLLIRAAPTEPTPITIRARGNAPRRVVLTPREGWLEERVELGRAPDGRLEIEIDSEVERALFHLWALQPIAR